MPDVDVHLARISIPVAQALSSYDGELKAPCVSVVVPIVCGKCGFTSDYELDHVEARRIGADPGPPCESCGAPTSVDVTAELRKAIDRLHLTRAAPEVVSYLHARPHNARIEVDFEDIPPPSEVSGIENITFGKYKLIRRLGMGGMAEIFLARQAGPQGFEKRVALKRILPNLCQDQAFVDMLLQEARLAARLSHPNIVQVLDLGQVGDQYFIALEYVKGWNLRLVLRFVTALGKQMPVELACRIVADVCAALNAAHTHVDDNDRLAPIVHRDVSPHNILLSRLGVVKLADFGIAKAGDSTTTEMGALKGKASYLAPERILSACQPLDPRPDIFSAGIVLYECLVDHNPFRRENHMETMQAIVHTTVDPPSRKRPGLPKGLDEIVMRAIARDPEERYQDARSFQQDLETLLLDMKTPATAVQLGEWFTQITDGAATLGLVKRATLTLTPSETTVSASTAQRSTRARRTKE